MEIKKLKGGTVITVKQDRLQVNIYADEAGFRVGSPGTLIGNVAFGAQLAEAAKRQYGLPEVVWAKVIFRHIGEDIYLVIGPAIDRGPDVYEIKRDAGSNTPIIRGLKLLFDDAKITLRRDRWYETKTDLVDDEDLGIAVAGDWTQAATRLRKKGEGEPETADGPKPETQDLKAQPEK